MAFHMTAAAAREILAAAGRSGAVGVPLRVAARPGHDGMAYGLGFDDPAADDEIAVFGGLTVLIGPDSREWLADTVLDFVELDTGGQDFVFVPAAPAAAGSCGSRRSACGSCGGGSCA